MNAELTNAKLWSQMVGYHSVNRPTERAAFDLWQFGYINLRAYFGKLVVPSWAQKTHLTIHEDDLKQHRKHRYCTGQVCVECQRPRPLTSHYWCRDQRQKDGFKTICKICDKKKRHKIA